MSDAGTARPANTGGAAAAAAAATTTTTPPPPPQLSDSRPLRREASAAPSLHLERALSRGVDPAKETKWRKPWQLGVTSFEEVLNGEYKGEGTKDNPYLVDWLDADRENPMNYKDSYKWMVAVFVSFSTLAVALSSSAYTGAIPPLREEFPASTVEYTLGVSLFVLGFALGPLIWAPFSELLGRRNLFLGTYLPLTLWSAVTIASPNLESVLVFRFLAGAFGSSPLTNAGGVLADIFNSKQRGLGMAVFASAPFMGPALGPIASGYLGEAAGWRWVFAMLAIFIACILGLGFLIMPETYAPYLLRQRAQKMSKATGAHYIPAMDKGKDVSFKTQFKIALARPWALLFLEPIALLLAIYMAIIYGILYSLFAAFPIVFEQQRGWSTGAGGLAFLGVLVGILCALVWIVFVENPRYVRAASKAPHGAAMPEERLVTAMMGAPLLTIGLAWFAASDGPNTHWIVPIIGSAPFGTGVVFVFLSAQNYLVDAYLIYAASVLAGNSFLRSLLGFCFPLFTPYMYQNLGVQWGASIPAFLSAICLPIPFLFYKYGASIRERCKYSAEAMRIGRMMMERNQQQQRKQSDASAPSDDADEAAPAALREKPLDEEAAPDSAKNRESAPATAPTAEQSAASGSSDTSSSTSRH